MEPLQNVVAALFRLEKSRGPEDIERVLSTLIGWLEDQTELRRAFATWLVKVLLPARLPGVGIPGVTDLQEVKSMLAERVKEWTQDWKQQGLEEGRAEGREEERTKVVAQARDILLRDLEGRFGPLSDETRRRIEALNSVEEVMRLGLRVGSALRLADLGLTD